MNGDASGLDIMLLSQRTGLAEDKLWQILTRNRKLREMPYSVKAGKGRVFFPPIVEWLARYEGLSDVPDKAVRDVRLPSGRALYELRKLVECNIISTLQAQRLLGVDDAPGIEESHVPTRRAIGLLQKIQDDMAARDEARHTRDRLQIRLPGMGV